MYISRLNNSIYIIFQCKVRENRVCHPKICLFWDNDYFKLVTFKKQKTQEETLTFPLIL